MTITDDILSWSVTNSLAGATVAEISVDNSSGNYDATDIPGRSVDLYITRDGVEYSVFHGIIESSDPKRESGYIKEAQLRAVSRFDALANTPVASETFDRKRLKQILTSLLCDYGSLNAGRDLRLRNRPNGKYRWVTVRDDSLAAACRTLAESGQMELFTDSDGKLRLETKRTTGSPVDYTLSTEYIDNIPQINHAVKDCPTICLVRGRLIGKDMSDASLIFVDKKTFEGWAQEENVLEVRVRPDIRMSKKQKRTATVTVHSGGTSGKIFKSVGSSDVMVKVEGTFPRSAFYEVNLSITGHEDATLVSGSDQHISLGQGMWDTLHARRLMTDVWDHSGYKRLNRRGQIRRGANEPTKERIEGIVQDASMVKTFGIRFTEVDNPYIQSVEYCEQIAARELLELTMQARRVTVEGPWVPELREVNKVVSVPVGGGSFERCLLTEVQTSFDVAKSEASARYELMPLTAI